MLWFETSLQADGYKQVAGLDEVGRGPLAGPVVAAAVILPRGERYDGLTDSKLLSPAQRTYWYSHIRTSAVAYSIAMVNEQDIDQINILVASRKAMEMALKGLSRRPDYLLVDGIVPLETGLPQRCLKKGDRRSQSIAAASVLAKVMRDRLMENYHEQYPQYNFKQNKGYGTKEHREALQQHGCSPLHRKSFRPVKDLFHTEDKKALDSFPGADKLL